MIFKQCLWSNFILACRIVPANITVNQFMSCWNY